MQGASQPITVASHLEGHGLSAEKGLLIMCIIEGFLLPIG